VFEFDVSNLGKYLLKNNKYLLKNIFWVFDIGNTVEGYWENAMSYITNE
jgi:hypothetical protein